VTARRFSAAIAALALGGCSLAPHYTRAVPPVPTSWPVGDAYLKQTEAALPAVNFADIFRDPRLQALVTQALANNQDIQLAAANLAAARAQIRVVRANQFPEVTAGATADFERTRTSSTEAGASGIYTGPSYALQGGVSSFELDLFGKFANATKAQRERALGTEAAARTVRLGLVADLATAWATYAADKDLLKVAQQTVASAKRSVALTSARLKGGIAPRTDLSQAQEVLETANGDAALQTAALAQDQNLVRLLVGADFDTALLPGSSDEVMANIANLQAGTSSDVLLRRPDVVEAEYDLKAAYLDIGVAKAELFPSISLTAIAGFASTGLSSLFDEGSFSYSAGGGADYSIFNAGGKLANVAVTKAQRDAALATYKKAVQTAFREVSDALADQGTLGERLRAAHAFTTATADVAKLEDARYREGIDSYLDNLDAQRNLYAAQKSEISTRLTAVENRVTLYRVLGGDQAVATKP
jgi:multidrug efflux system outer membrane protein